MLSVFHLWCNVYIYSIHEYIHAPVNSYVRSFPSSRYFVKERPRKGEKEEHVRTAIKDTQFLSRSWPFHAGTLQDLAQRITRPRLQLTRMQIRGAECARDTLELETMEPPRADASRGRCTFPFDPARVGARGGGPREGGAKVARKRYWRRALDQRRVDRKII